jgi:hypothetical protein
MYRTPICHNGWKQKYIELFPYYDEHCPEDIVVEYSKTLCIRRQITDTVQYSCVHDVISFLIY